MTRVVFGATDDTKDAQGRTWAYPDTVVGTDSHTTMANGLGVMAWGVGGIEAEAAMLGQPVTMLIPEVIGFKLVGNLREGVTATDLVLTVTEMLRKKGVVSKFVEFYGSGLNDLPVADRNTLGNMSPEYGSTIAIFPIDDQTLAYLRLTGRTPRRSRSSSTMRKRKGCSAPTRRPIPPTPTRSNSTSRRWCRTSRGPTPSARPGRALAT